MGRRAVMGPISNMRNHHIAQRAGIPGSTTSHHSHPIQGSCSCLVRVHIATQPRIHNANGVEVYGQSKAGKARRGFPVERLTADYARRPTTGKAVGQAIAEADLIVYAPGSLYTSMIPLLQLEPIVDAIRSNRKALKVLPATHNPASRYFR